MANSTKFFLFFTLGLVITGFGVGGVENSISNEQLIPSIGVAVLGLTLMYLSTVYANKEDQNDY